MTAFLRSSSGQPLTKTVTPTEIRQFSEVKTFDIENIEFTSFDDMATILDWLGGEPDRALIRGNAIQPGPRQPRLLRDQSDGRKANIVPVPDGLRWIMLDIDKVPAPHDLADTNEARLAYMRSYLPVEFREATTYYQWSSSAGVRGWDIMSAHFFFWLDAPKLCKTLHTRSDKGDWKNQVDPAPYTPNQIHYTARPIFEGCIDPVDGRSGVLRGTGDTVALSPWTPPYKPRSVYTASAREALTPHASFNDHIREIGEMGHYHLPILRAISHYVAITPSLRRNKEFCLSKVAEAAAGAGREYINEQYYQRLYHEAEYKFGAL